MFRICYICKGHLDPYEIEPIENTNTTHGLCDKCYKLEKARMDKEMVEIRKFLREEKQDAKSKAV